MFTTTVKVSKKELNRLIDLAQSRGQTVRVDTKGEVDNVYVDGVLFAESMPGHCNLILLPNGASHEPLTLSLKAPCNKKEIKDEIEKLRALLAIRAAESELIIDGIRHYQKQCQHPGQTTGYNERDGSWTCPCPVCGYSE